MTKTLTSFCNTSCILLKDNSYMYLQDIREGSFFITIIINPCFKFWLGVMVFNATFGIGNRSTRKKPPTCRKSLINFIT